MAISETGIWETEDGEVVYELPRGRATQIVAKGSEIGSAAKSRLAVLGVTVEDDEPKADADTVNEDDQAEPVKSTTARKSSRKG